MNAKKEQFGIKPELEPKSTGFTMSVADLTNPDVSNEKIRKANDAGWAGAV